MRLVWIQASEVSPYWHVETQVSGRAQTTLSKSQQLKVGSALAFCNVACKDSKSQKLPVPYFSARSFRHILVYTVSALPVAWTCTSLLSPLTG